MTFTTLERRWIVSAMESFAPPGNKGLTVSPGEVDFVHALEVFAKNSTLRGAFGMRLAVWIAGLSPLIILGRFCTLPSLDLAARAEVITKLLTHRVYLIRGLSLLIKVGASFAIFGTPSMRARSGYDTPSPSAAKNKSVRALGVVTEARREVP